ncbi:MAG: FecR family protein [Armatimonadota bacterium]
MRASGVTAFAIFAALILTAPGVLADAGELAASQAVLTSMYGEVHIAHGTESYHPASLNELLRPGDTIRTGPASRAELTVGEGGFVRLDENSQVRVTALSTNGRSTLQAVVGGIWVTIERALTGGKKWEVRMPSAVASVKGTVFRCRVTDDISETVVYEGQVEISAGIQSLQVQADRRCRVPADLRVEMGQFDLTGDDASAWVMYNRHRDIIQHLGSPTIMVALRDHDMPPETVFSASRRVAAQFALHGLHNTSAQQVGGAEYSLRPDGTIQWHSRPEADFCVIGDVSLDGLRQDGNALYAARVSGDIRLARAGDERPLTSVEATGAGFGRRPDEAVGAALMSLGRRVGVAMGPRVIREMMHGRGRPEAVRVDITGATRSQVAQLRSVISEMDSVRRAAPLVLPGGGISLAVITEAAPGEIAAHLRERIPNQLERLEPVERVLLVAFRTSDTAPGPVIPGQEDVEVGEDEEGPARRSPPLPPHPAPQDAPPPPVPEADVQP